MLEQCADLWLGVINCEFLTPLINFHYLGSATNAPNAAIQPDLRVVNSPTILISTCNQPNVHASRVLTSHICAGSIGITNPASGPCIGNIGSGLYCNNQLTGVLTFGTSCGAINNPGVYVDIRQYEGKSRKAPNYLEAIEKNG